MCRRLTKIHRRIQFDSATFCPPFGSLSWNCVNWSVNCVLKMNHSVWHAVFAGPCDVIWDPRTSHICQNENQLIKWWHGNMANRIIPGHLRASPNHGDLFVISHIVDHRIQIRVIGPVAVTDERLICVNCIRCGRHIGDTVVRCTRCVHWSILMFCDEFADASRYRAKPIPCVRSISAVCACRWATALVVAKTICIYAICRLLCITIVCGASCRTIIVSRCHFTFYFPFVFSHFRFRCNWISCFFNWTRK